MKRGNAVFELTFQIDLGCSKACDDYAETTAQNRER